MKNPGKLLLAAATLFITAELKSQVSVGAKGGMNISQLSGLSIPEVETKAYFGFHVGGFVNIALGKLSLQPELLYSTQGAKLEDATSTSNLKLNYFNIPIMLRYTAKGGFFLETGPQFGFNSSAKLDETNYKDSMQNADFAWGIGLGLQGKKLGIGARYNVGISKVSDVSTVEISDINYQNGVLQVSLYFKIFGK
jgi:hypothetical protein